MNVRLAPLAIFNSDGQDFGLESRSATDLAQDARHECADPVAREFAFRFLVKPLHLRHESLKRTRLLLSSTIARKTHFNRFITSAEVKRLFELIRQFRKGRVFVDPEMFHEGSLQMAIIRLHSLRTAT